MTYNAIEFLEGLFVSDIRRGGAVAVWTAPPVAPAGLDVDDLPGDWRVWFEERAAIKEYHGHLPRELAEAQALTETIEEMRREKVENVLDRQ